MQIPLRVLDDVSTLTPATPEEAWAAPARRGRQPASPAQKIGVFATMAVHLLVVAGLLIDWHVRKDRAPEPMVFVQLTEPAPPTPLIVPPSPILKPVKPDLTRFDMPVIEEPTNAITQDRPPPPPPPSQAALETYSAKLFRHLYLHKRPAKQQGIVYVAFTIDERGRVLSKRIAKSSGIDALDSEALSLIERSSPVPAPPDGMIHGQGEVALPIEFKLSGFGN